MGADKGRTVRGDIKLGFVVNMAVIRNHCLL